MYSGGSSSSGRRGSRDVAAPNDAWDESEKVYSTSLPPTLPVVKETVDSLVALAVKQRMFISSHADRVKIELVKERADPSVAIGQWHLNGFVLSDEDAVDFVRQCPDALSNLTYVPFADGTGLWSRLTSWLRFGAKDEVKALNVVDDLAFVLTVAETVEVAGHVLGAVSYAMTQTMVKGEPFHRELAVELSSSAHRGMTHSMYLMATVVHAAHRVASGRTANTLRLDLSLYIHEPLLLGGVAGVAVNISGTRVDDVPAVDVDQYELRELLAKKGVFVASAVSDFVLNASLAISPNRAATITTVSTDKLTSSANKALVSFFDDEASGLEIDREKGRRERDVREAEEREEKRIEQLRKINGERARARREADMERSKSARSRDSLNSVPQPQMTQYIEYPNGPYMQDSRWQQSQTGPSVR